MDREQEFSEIFKANYNKIVYFFRRENFSEWKIVGSSPMLVFLRAYKAFDDFRGDAKTVDLAQHDRPPCPARSPAWARDRQAQCGGRIPR